MSLIPQVWSWDNCFNGLALASASLDSALDQILLPFDHITAEGRLPDSLTRSEVLYDFTKPPIYGWTMFNLLQQLDPASSTPSFHLIPRTRLGEVYTKVALFTTFWYTHRKTKHSSLPYYSHGNDSGWDNATCFDHQTTCVSPDLAAFLVVQCDFLAQTAAYLSLSGSRWAKQRDDTLKALVEELWDDVNGEFLFKDAYDGRTWRSTSLLRLIPLVAATYLPASMVGAMVNDLDQHLTPMGLATEPVSSSLYEPDGYWRGPIWAPPTLLIQWGLRQRGHHDRADAISDRYVALCEKNGFAENYNAESGVGNRDLSYTWSASVYLILRKEQRSEPAEEV
jgi:glycogen debranching enzyme